MTDRRLALECRAALRAARDYASWRDAALAYDAAAGHDDWKESDPSPDYDWQLIRMRLNQVRQYRETRQIDKLVRHLRQGLHWNLGNSANPALYGVAWSGTKRLIDAYLGEVATALQFVADGHFPELPLPEKRRFFAETAQSFGRSALMLSGGATLGLFHVGVVKTLFQRGLLPDVISGSSAGSIVASVVGTHSEDELESLLDPESSYYHFWKPLAAREVWRQGALFDQRQIALGIARNTHDLTFEEAFARSGRSVNITVSPAGSNQAPRLLNHLTTPYLYLREAVLASSAVPLLFPPVQLMTMDEHGQRVPYLPSLRWTDGSLKSDLPGIRLRRLHNVNHFIVSQTNPHVIPFLRKTHGEDGLAGAVRDAAFGSVRGAARSVLGIGRLGTGLPGVRRTIDTASAILEQNYRGHVTILPKVTVWRYAHVTANPKLAAVTRFIFEGERATWKRIAMIENQTLISRTLARCLKQVEDELANPQTARGNGRRLRAVPKRDGGRSRAD